MINEPNALEGKAKRSIKSCTEGVTEDAISITYGVTEEIYSLSDNSRKSYGIAGYCNSQGEETATIVVSVNDITSDRDKLEELVQICNRCELSPIQLNDVITDFLAN